MSNEQIWTAIGAAFIWVICTGFPTVAKTVTQLYSDWRGVARVDERTKAAQAKDGYVFVIDELKRQVDNLNAVNTKHEAEHIECERMNAVLKERVAQLERRVGSDSMKLMDKKNAGNS